MTLKHLVTRICWIAAAAGGAVYLVVLGLQIWSEEPSLVPYTWAWWLLAVIWTFFVAWACLSWEDKPASPPAAPARATISSIPGQTRHGRLISEQKIGTDVRTVKWAENKAIAGYLVPSANRGGWHVLDADENELDWAKNVEDGLAILERRAP